MARFDRMDGTAPVQSALKNQEVKVPRSRFNLSRSVYGKLPIGLLAPIDVFPILPNSDYNISIDLNLENINPFVKNVKTGYTAYVHTYYMYDRELWEGAQNSRTKGRSGTIIKDIPTLSSVFYGSTTNGETVAHFRGDSLFMPMDYMGLPVSYCNGTYTSGSSPTLKEFLTPSVEKNDHIIPSRSALSQVVNALPFVMYQDIYREKYAPKNLLQDNKKIYPDNYHHTILPYDTTSANVLYYEMPYYFNNLYYDVSTPDSEFAVPVVHYDSSGNVDNSRNRPLLLSAPRYRQARGDYFNTALPFAELYRGDESENSISLGEIVGNINWDNVFTDDVIPNPESKSAVYFTSANSSHDGTIGTYVPNGSSDAIYPTALKDIFSRAVVRATANASISLNNLRALEAYTLFGERMARTDGSYNEMIYAMFGSNPHDYEYQPHYVGGTSVPLLVGSVTNQSSSDFAPLGEKSSNAFGVGSGHIGRFHSDDYGYCMTILSLVPDEVYSQGVDRWWTNLSQKTQYFPLMNNLPAQMILNKELFFQHNDTFDNDGFGWTERFSEYKSRRNIAVNDIGAAHGNYFTEAGAYVAKRHFTSVPKLNAEFVTLSPKNVDMSVFSSSDDIPFVFTANCYVDAVLPMPYITQPGGLSPRG